MKTPIEVLKDQLETEIDSHGIGQVLGLLADIMREKAEHIRANWQDPYLAKVFEKQSTEINRLAERFSEEA